MKRFIAVLSGLLVLPAFAEVAPVYYDEIVEYTDEMLNESDIPAEEIVEETNQQPQQQPKIIQRNVAGRSVSRTTSGGNTTNSRVNNSSRAVASSPRNAQQTPRGTVSRTTKSRNTATRPAVVSRSRANTARTATVSARNTNNNKATVARVSANGDVIPGNRVSNSSNPKMLTDSGEPLYLSNTSRAAVNARRASSRALSSIGTQSTPVITNDDITDTTSTLSNLAELTEYCKAQYATCMDNYCNVLDENQGRCSCSANIKTYEKTEQSLSELSENFQDVVQKIKYIGLTTTQIEALFSETEAEIAMKTNTDSSQLKNSLEAIKRKIIDVSSGKTTSSMSDGLAFDMSGLLDFNSDFSAIFDLNSFLGTSSKVSSQRGTALFNTATQRCKTAVLNSCTEQGIDPNVIKNSYDLAIDKQCVEYERNLNEANTEMRNNVRNAQSILQQARLLLAQKKNAYDLRGCVAALDECMQDEYVCGEDYELCLDPSGKYLAKGAVVKGGTPGIAGGSVRNQTSVTSTTIMKWISCGMYGLYSTWDYTPDNTEAPACTCPVSTSDPTCTGGLNAWGGGNTENLNDYIDAKIARWKADYKYKNWANLPANDMAIYLLRRVGYIDTKEDKSYGMCADVMKQCQDYTFSSQNTNNKQYMPDNEVVRQYLALALTKIKLKQDEILSDYAETCWNDVYSCLATNNYDENGTTSTTSRTAVNACRSDIATCMSATGYHPSDNETLTLSDMTVWVASKMLSCPVNQYLVVTYNPAESTILTTSNSPRALQKAECVPCPFVKCAGVENGESATAHPKCNVYYATNHTIHGTYQVNDSYGIYLESSGGQVTSCSCPEGFTEVTGQGTDDAAHGFMGTKACRPSDLDS